MDETVPHGAVGQDTDHFIPLLLVSLLTLAVKFAEVPASIVAEVWESDTLMGRGGGGGGEGEPPPHPKRPTMRPTTTSTSISDSQSFGLIGDTPPLGSRELDIVEMRQL